MAWRPHGKASVDPSNPQAFAVCDRCGGWRNLVNLIPEVQYNGTGLYNTGFLVCQRCLDIPQPQLLSPIIPPDPMPVLNPRVEPYFLDEVDVLTSDGSAEFVTEEGGPKIVVNQPSENFSKPPGSETP